jgi:hypothetical protein
MQAIKTTAGMTADGALPKAATPEIKRKESVRYIYLQEQRVI